MPPLGTLAFVISLVAWASYVPMAKIPSVRHTMWPTWMLQFAALGLGIAGVLPGPDNVVPFAFAALAIAGFAAWIFVFTTILKIPTAPGRPEAGKRIQHVTLVSESGHPISPDDFIGKGPLLLIFFRGFW